MYCTEDEIDNGKDIKSKDSECKKESCVDQYKIVNARKRAVLISIR